MDVLLSLLEEYREKALKDYLKNLTIQLSTERALVTCINICIDIGAHILSTHGKNTADSYSEIFLLLGKEKIIPTDFAEVMREMVAFRNRLGHFYLEINQEIVYDILQTHLSDFTRFKQLILQMLENSEP